MPFTPIVGGLDWQAASFVNEMIKAIDERDKILVHPWVTDRGYSANIDRVSKDGSYYLCAISHTSGTWATDLAAGKWTDITANAFPNGVGYADIAAGTDIQAAAFWHTIQDWIEATCVKFVDDTQFPIEGTPSGTPGSTTPGTPPMFNWTSFKVAAGIDNGWRRATTWVPTTDDWTADVSFTYGAMEAGDIIGPWIFADIRSALLAMKWTYLNGDFTEGQMRLGGDNGYNHGYCSDDTTFVVSRVVKVVTLTIDGTPQNYECPTEAEAIELEAYWNASVSAWSDYMNATNGWDAGWIASTLGDYYGALLDDWHTYNAGSFPTDLWLFDAVRVKAKPYLDAVSGHRPCVPDIYGKATADLSGYTYRDFDALWVTARGYGVGEVTTYAGTNYKCAEAHTSGDFATDLAAGKWAVTTDDAGWPQDDWHLIETLDEASDETRTGAMLGAYDTDPNTVVGRVCPLAEGTYQEQFVVGPTTVWILKWNFEWDS